MMLIAGRQMGERKRVRGSAMVSPLSSAPCRARWSFFVRDCLGVFSPLFLCVCCLLFLRQRKGREGEGGHKEGEYQYLVPSL